MPQDDWPAMPSLACLLQGCDSQRENGPAPPAGLCTGPIGDRTGFFPNTLPKSTSARDVALAPAAAAQRTLGYAPSDPAQSACLSVRHT